jgi:hypothetical protein
MCNSMRLGNFARIRAVALLLAFGVGLLGQAVMAAAMPMPMQMLQQDSMAMSLAGESGECPACPPMPDNPGAQTCIFSLCAVPPAVLPSGLITAPRARATFQPAASRDNTGITVRPDLGPPRPIRHV